MKYKWMRFYSLLVLNLTHLLIFYQIDCEKSKLMLYSNPLHGPFSVNQRG